MVTVFKKTNITFASSLHEHLLKLSFASKVTRSFKRTFNPQGRYEENECGMSRALGKDVCRFIIFCGEIEFQDDI